MILIGGMAAGVFLFMLVAIFMNLTKGPLVPAMNKHQTTLSWAMAAL